MYFLGRTQESLAYFKLALAIMELELGPFHYRSNTVSSFRLTMIDLISPHRSAETFPSAVKLSLRRLRHLLECGKPINLIRSHQRRRKARKERKSRREIIR